MVWTRELFRDFDADGSSSDAFSNEFAGTVRVSFNYVAAAYFRTGSLSIAGHAGE